MVDIQKEAEKVLGQFYKGKKLKKMKAELAKTMDKLKSGEMVSSSKNEEVKK